MRTTNKRNGDPTNELISFQNSNPTADWEDFRKYNSGNDYTIIKTKIFEDQSELCAYCEVNLKDAKPHNKRLEHFRSKSDRNATTNISLDWTNIIGVCLGGTDFLSKNEYELPINLSCDSHKAHFEEKNKIIDKDWNGKVLSPLDMPNAPLLFTFDKATGKLLANVTNCQLTTINNNKLPTTLELVNNTIKVFNLNCPRLNNARLVIFHELQRKLKSKDINLIRRLTISWNRTYPLPFQTTRDIILRDNRITAQYL